MRFHKTKSKVAICPFFTWTSENIEGEGHTENDVSITFCSHPKNPDDYEGNYQKEQCPLLKRKEKENAKNKNGNNSRIYQT